MDATRTWLKFNSVWEMEKFVKCLEYGMEYEFLPVCLLRWLHRQHPLHLPLPNASVVIKSKWTLAKVLWNTIWSCFCRAFKHFSAQFSREWNFWYFFTFITSLVHFSWSPAFVRIYCRLFFCLDVVVFLYKGIPFGVWAFCLVDF